MWVICSWRIYEWMMCVVFWRNALDSLKLRGRSACASVLFISLPPNQQIENYHSRQKMKLEYSCGTEIMHPSQYTACTFPPPSQSHQRLQVEVLYLPSCPFHPWNTIRDFLRLSMSFLLDHLRAVYHSHPTSLALMWKDQDSFHPASSSWMVSVHNKCPGEKKINE